MNLTTEILKNTMFIPYPNGDETTSIIATNLNCDTHNNNERFVCSIFDDSIYYDLIIATPLVTRALLEAIETLQSISNIIYLNGDIDMHEKFNSKIESLQLAYDAALEGVVKISRKLQHEEKSKKL